MCSGCNWNACVLIICYLVNQQNNLKETFEYYTASRADYYTFCAFSFSFLPSSFQSREKGSIFGETSCWNASHQCSCSSADLRAPVCASCTIFHIPVVRDRLRSTHPNNRKVVSLAFPTVFIYKRALFLIPNDTLSWKAGVWVEHTTWKQHSNHTSDVFVA